MSIGWCDGDNFAYLIEVPVYGDESYHNSWHNCNSTHRCFGIVNIMCAQSTNTIMAVNGEIPSLKRFDENWKPSWVTHNIVDVNGEWMDWPELVEFMRTYFD